jgi:mono/diheme cytochrome c family protein
MKWIAVLVIVGVAGLAACERKPEEAPVTEQAPAAAPAPAAPAPAPQTTGPLPEGVTPEMVASGKQIFTGQGICFTCHGADGKGTPLAPDLTSGNWLDIDKSKGDLLGQIENVVKTGVPQPKQFPAPMPPMGGAQLTPEQIKDVSAYVLSISGAKS